jgi:hypothetical protein
MTLIQLIFTDSFYPRPSAQSVSSACHLYGTQMTLIQLIFTDSFYPRPSRLICVISVLLFIRDHPPNLRHQRSIFSAFYSSTTSLIQQS